MPGMSLFHVVISLYSLSFIVLGACYLCAQSQRARKVIAVGVILLLLAVYVAMLAASAS